MKKTLVFYKGRAPKGEKTNWVMHEYRLEGKFSHYNLPKSAKNEWVICRVFQKSSGGKKIIVSGLVRLNSYGDEMGSSSSFLPPLMDSSNYSEKIRRSIGETTRAHVSCFSNSMEAQKNQEEMIDCFSSSPPRNLSVNPSFDMIIQNPSLVFSKFSHNQNPFYSNLHQNPSNLTDFQYPVTGLIQDQVILRSLLENNGSNLKQQSFKPEKDQMVSISQETGLTTDMNTEISSVVSNQEMGRQSFNDQDDPSTSAGPVDLDCLWNY